MSAGKRRTAMNVPENAIQVKLEKIKGVACIRIMESDIAHLVDDVEVTTWAGLLADEVLLRVRYHVWGEDYAHKQIRYPADWIEAVKERWFPCWAKRHWPVRYCIHDITTKAYYPGISEPPKLGHSYDWRLMAEDRCTNEKKPEEW